MKKFGQINEGEIAERNEHTRLRDGAILALPASLPATLKGEAVALSADEHLATFVLTAKKM